jgi:hypothetical protein
MFHIQETVQSKRWELLNNCLPQVPFRSGYPSPASAKMPPRKSKPPPIKSPMYLFFPKRETNGARLIWSISKRQLMPADHTKLLPHISKRDRRRSVTKSGIGGWFSSTRSGRRERPYNADKNTRVPKIYPATSKSIAKVSGSFALLSYAKAILSKRDPTGLRDAFISIRVKHAAWSWHYIPVIINETTPK